MLKQRIITAAILLPIAIIGFFLLEGLAFAVFIGWLALGAWEWARMAGFTSQPVRVGYAALVVILLGLLYQLPGLAPWLLAVAAVLSVLLPSWQALILLKRGSWAWLILAVMILVWAADIGAYFSGSASELAPQVSPGKLGGADRRSADQSCDHLGCGCLSWLVGARVDPRASRRRAGRGDLGDR